MKMEVTQSIIIVENTVEYMLCFFLYKIIGTGHATRNVLHFFLVYLYYGIMCGVSFV